MFQRSNSIGAARGEEASKPVYRRSSTVEHSEEATSPSSSPFAIQPSGRRASWSGGCGPREQLGAERSLRRRQSSTGGEEPLDSPSPRSESFSGGFSFFSKSPPSPQLESVDEKSPFFGGRAHSDTAGFRQTYHSPPPLLQLPRAHKVPIQVQTGKSVVSNNPMDDNKRAKQMGLLAGAASLVAVYSASTVL
eukprot:CAMPEP_0177770132 /NCGR_PEP_ID=MMETSP0491_2-20121128/10745_1 /TAXON_ID=63592 /ORGANISM="Tetraselmis chuii, Strain PLY429" /LENGTH=191 /DNA_ID=CAMNT_0019287293 /DNA_START=349 /DNA_END=924 /DNA_ORIENTATION=-